MKKKRKLSDFDRFEQIATKMVKLSLIKNLISKWEALKEGDPINNDIFQLPALVGLNLSNVAADDDHDIERYISNILLDGTNEFFEDESVKTLMKDINNQGKNISGKFKNKEYADAYDKIILNADFLRVGDAMLTLYEDLQKDKKEFDFKKFIENSHGGLYFSAWLANYKENFDSVDDIIKMTESSIYDPFEAVDSMYVKPGRGSGGKRDIDVYLKEIGVETIIESVKNELNNKSKN